MDVEDSGKIFASFVTDFTRVFKFDPSCTKAFGIHTFYEWGGGGGGES